MLDVGIITFADITHTFTASAHFPASYLKTRLERLEELWGRSQADLPDAQRVESKFALNALFGFWSIVDHNAYTLRVSSDPDDVLATVVRSTPSPGQERGVFHDHIRSVSAASAWLWRSFGTSQNVL